MPFLGQGKTHQSACSFIFASSAAWAGAGRNPDICLIIKPIISLEGSPALLLLMTQSVSPASSSTVDESCHASIQVIENRTFVLSDGQRRNTFSSKTRQIQKFLTFSLNSVAFITFSEYDRNCAGKPAGLVVI
jgi:hypothetical protein